MSEVVDKISKMYTFKTYGDLYGGSSFMSIFIILLGIGLSVYYYIKLKKNEIKKDWNVKKCNPLYIPFAGMIHEEDGVSPSEYTNKNFHFCVSSILNKIFAVFTKPMEYTSTVILQGLKRVFNSINMIREKILDVNKNFTKIIETIMSRLLNFMIPIQNIAIKMKDTIGKVQGIMTASIFAILNGYYSIISFMKSFVRMMILFMVMVAALIIPFWIFPWTWPVAIAGTAFLGVIIVFMGVITGNVARVLSLSGFSPLDLRRYPVRKPRCFDKNTKLRMENNTYKKITNIKIGDVLMHDGKVTGLLELDSTNEVMYRVPISSKKHILVSGNHLVFDEENEKFVPVKEYMYSEMVTDYNESKIYCITTEYKTIHIGNTLFSDWDDLHAKDISKVLRSRVDITQEYYGGWFGFTKVEMNDGSFKYMYEIRSGDVLADDNKVLGTCRVAASDKYKYSIIVDQPNNIAICGGHIISDNIVDIHKHSKGPYKGTMPVFLYNLITEKETYKIGTHNINDVNYVLEKNFGY